MTINGLRSECDVMLEGAGIADHKTDAMLLMMHALKVSRDHILAHGSDPVDDDKAAALRELVRIRCDHVPLQHITGHQEFMGLDFAVNEHVLVPRLDTECLVEEAMIETQDGMRVLDLCTGSGCILISLMKYKNQITGIGTDISDKALEVAMENAASNGVDAVFLQGDLYAALDDSPAVNKGSGSRFDVIISNPPYIRSDVISTLMEEVKDHEPLSALDGGSDGLMFYRRIIEGADEWLTPGGCILFEIGYDQGSAVSGMLSDKDYRDVTVIKDFAGLDRVVKGHKRI
ncbi:MAG: peptide chain release factor N(5)-glutamine methyltransferase [Lachnospiraceae bacterium]|nr:peptide chain release factor N(5)-glutamine methyltransferase [Lachnospiraceae bacterium]